MTNTSKFGFKETLEVAGFELLSYRTLLAREKIAINYLKKSIYNNTLRAFQIKKSMADILGVKVEGLNEALANMEGQTEETKQEQVLQLMSEIVDINDTGVLDLKYLKGALSIFLRSRLDGDWLVENHKELTEYFHFTLTDKDVKAYAKVDFKDKLESNVVTKVTDEILEHLSDQTLLSLSSFLEAESLGLSIEEFEAVEPEEEVESPKTKGQH